MRERERLPFPDNHFDYVYCSHVIEDFWEPMIIVDELIRICKVGGLIELRAPTEANLHLTNPYHKVPFTLFKFKAIATKLKNYGKKYNLEIIELKYYTNRNRCKIYNIFLLLNEFFYNLLPYKLVERTFLKYFLAFVDCKVIYKKTK